MSAQYHDFWPLLQAIYTGRVPAVRKVHPGPPPIDQISAEFNADMSQLGAALYIFENYNINALSTDHYRIRNCYDNPAVIDRQMQAITDAGLIDSNGDGTYRINERGRHFFYRVREILRPRSVLPVLTDAELERLLELVRKVVAATHAAPEPPLHWSVTTRSTQGIAMPKDASPLEQLNWHTFDLWAYRDDVHLATWKDYGVSPFAWEALTYLWRGDYDTVEKLAEINGYRELSAEQWQAHLDKLIGKGWVEQTPENIYRLTSEGQRVRDEAERQTDAWFYQPWTVLSEAEADELRDLLTRLKDDLARLAA